MRRFRFRWWYGLVALALAIVVTGAILYVVPSSSFVYLPDRARPANPLVHVPGDKNRSSPGGIYMVDVIVRRASILETLFPGIDDGATIVPGEQFNPLGASDEARRKSGHEDMTRSQKFAAAVALRALDYHVETHASGVVVNQVDPDAPAADAFEIGDVIVGVEGRTIRTTTQLQHAMARVHPGATVSVTVRRGDGLRKIRAGTHAAKDPSGGSRAVFGIIVEQAARIRLPAKISIDAGNIGGPSAGLAFALDIVDELGPDIDRGRTIVATGEIALDGSVGPIGGIKQKTIGARQADADLFIVPKENAAGARRYADGLRIVPVTTFEQALRAVEAS